MKENAMNTLTKYLTAAFRFFRRPAVAVTVEPDRADGQSWLTAPAGTVSWEAALSGAAQRQQAQQPLG
jgi:hypothetical protein